MTSRSPSNRKVRSHSRILHSAADMLGRAGYHGVSLTKVMKEAGLTHGGFYAHFDSRDDLIAAAVTVSGQKKFESLVHKMQLMQEKGSTPFEAFVECYLSDSFLTNRESGCIVSMLSSEMARQQGKVREASCEHIMSLINLIQGVLPLPNVQAKAMLIASSVVGALQLARALDDDTGKQLLAETRKLLLEQYDM